MEEAGEIVDILGSTILSAVKMLPNTEENKEVSKECTITNTIF